MSPISTRSLRPSSRWIERAHPALVCSNFSSRTLQCGVPISTARPVWCSLQPGGAETRKISSQFWPAASTPTRASRSASACIGSLRVSRNPGDTPSAVSVSPTFIARRESSSVMTQEHPVGYRRNSPICAANTDSLSVSFKQPRHRNAVAVRAVCSVGTALDCHSIQCPGSIVASLPFLEPRKCGVAVT